MDELYLRLAALARRFGAKRLVLFGSRARGDGSITLSASSTRVSVSSRGMSTLLFTRNLSPINLICRESLID